MTDIIVQFAPLQPIQSPHLVLDPVSRTSPQIDNDVLYFGTVTHALLVAVNRKTGAVLATKQINSHPVACITQAPTFYNGRIYVGSSSREESAITVPGYKCCSFIGNFQSLTAQSYPQKVHRQLERSNLTVHRRMVRRLSLGQSAIDRSPAQLGLYWHRKSVSHRPRVGEMREQVLVVPPQQCAIRLHHQR